MTNIANQLYPLLAFKDARPEKIKCPDNGKLKTQIR